MEELEATREKTSLARAWLAGDFAERWSDGVDRKGPSFKLRFAAHNPRDVFVVREVFEPAFRVLAKMSRDRLTIEAIWDERSHALHEGWTALRDRRVDITACYPSGSPELGFGLFEALYLPGLFSGAHVATLASELVYKRYLESCFDRQGVRMGRLKATSSDVIFSRRKIQGVEDMRGLRISASPGWHGEFYRQLGATVVLNASPQVASAFDAGEVDAVAMTDGSAKVFGVDMVAKYRLSTNLGRLNLPYCMAPQSFDQLPGDLRAVLSAWFSGLAQAEAQVFYGVGGAEARAGFRSSGLLTAELHPQDRIHWDELAAVVRRRFASTMDAKGLPGSQLLEDLSEIARRHGQSSENELMQRAIDSPVAEINEP